MLSGLKKKIDKVQLSWSVVFPLVLGSGLIGIGLKFISLFDKWLYFPTFPNIVDSIFIVFCGMYVIFGRRIEIE